MLDPECFGDGGHYILKPKAKIVQQRFINVKHAFDGKIATLMHPVQLPKTEANYTPAQGIENGQLLLST